MQGLAGLGLREVEARPPRLWKIRPRDCLVERAKDLGWGLQGGAGQTWRRGRRFVGVGL